MRHFSRLKARNELRQDWDYMNKKGLVSTALLDLYWAEYSTADRASFTFLMEKFSLIIQLRPKQTTVLADHLLLLTLPRR